MDSLVGEIKALTPSFAKDERDQWDEQFVQSITQSVDIAVAFARVSDAVSLMNMSEAATAIFKGFGPVLELYAPPPEHKSSFEVTDYDVARFLGHELFVTFITALIREDRWAIIGSLLVEELYVSGNYFDNPRLVPVTAISEPVRLLEMRKERLKSSQASLHADLLKELHTQGELGRLVPIEQFAEADYFLFLRYELPPEEPPQWPEWMAWSTICMDQVPRYLTLAEQTPYAKQLMSALGFDDLAMLRARFAQRANTYYRLWPRSQGYFFRLGPMSNYDANKLGSR